MAWHKANQTLWLIVGKIYDNLVIWITNADVLTREKILELNSKIEQVVKQPLHIFAISEVKPKYITRDTLN